MKFSSEMELRLLHGGLVDNWFMPVTYFGPSLTL